MIRIPGWIVGAVAAAGVAACGAGDSPEAQEELPVVEEVPVQSEPAANDAAANDTAPGEQAADGPARPPAEATPAAAGPSEGEPAAAPTPPIPTDRLYTVQVGSFVTPDSARVWTERLEARGLPVWTTQATVRGRRYHRLRIGASPSRSEAVQLGARLGREYHWPVWVTPVDDNAAVPPSAISRTHALVTGS